MKKVIVTGATSFIGRHLIRRLCEKDYEIIAVIRPDSEKKRRITQNKKLKIVELCMAEYDKLPEHIHGRYDAFYSLAWDGTRGRARNDSKIQKMNYEYSLKALESADRIGCEMFVSAGSQAEYGKIDGIITEDIEPLPDTEYGKYKLQFYEEAKEYCKKKRISFKEPRIFSLYGEDDFPNSMIMSILGKMLINAECDLTECTQWWNFLYIDDAIEVLSDLLERPCEDGVYNVASEDTRILKEFVEEMHQTVGSKSKLNYGKIMYPPNGKLDLRPDITKTMNALNWQPSICFKDGIVKIQEYLKRNRK